MVNFAYTALALLSFSLSLVYRSSNFNRTIPEGSFLARTFRCTKLTSLNFPVGCSKDDGWLETG